MHVAGDAGDIAQAAGLQVRQAGAPAPAAAQRAVGAGHGQRSHQLAHQGRGPGVLQQARQLLGADALLARQARTALEQRHLRAQPLAPPAAQHLARAFHAAGSLLLQAQRQEQLLGHHVVAVFVDVANDLGERRRLQLEHRPQRGRHRSRAHRASQGAAERLPHARHGARRVTAGIGMGDRPAALAAGLGIGAAEADTRGVAEVGLQGGAPVAAFARGQRHGGRQLHPGQRRFDMQQRLATAGGERHRQRLEIDQQRFRRGVVRAQRLAVERARLGRRDLESAAVQDDVAGDAADAQALDPAQQQPEPLDHQLGVALALDVKVALEHAAFHRPVHEYRRGPGESRPELLERGEGGGQLGEGSRVHGRRHTMAQPGRRLALGIGHQQRDSIARQFCADQSRLDLGRQRLRAKRRAGQRGQRGQPQCQEVQRAHPAIIGRSIMGCRRLGTPAP